MVTVVVSKSNTIQVSSGGKNNSIVLKNTPTPTTNKVEISKAATANTENVKVVGQTRINVLSAVNPLQQEPDLDGGSF